VSTPSCKCYPSLYTFHQQVQVFIH